MITPRDLFEAYNRSTGGRTWDGKEVPPYGVIAERTPHVARAWEAVGAHVATELERLAAEGVSLEHLRAGLVVLARRLRGDESTALEADAAPPEGFARVLA